MNKAPKMPWRHLKRIWITYNFSFDGVVTLSVNMKQNKQTSNTSFLKRDTTNCFRLRW